MKKLRKLALRILVLAIIMLLGIWVLLDRIVQSSIEVSASSALGVTTRIERLSINPIDGEMQIYGLTIANPPGFVAPHLLKANLFALKINPASILTDTIALQKFVLNGLDLNYEQRINDSNISALLAKSKQSGDEGKSRDPGGEKKIKANRILITDVAINFKLSSFGMAINAPSYRLPIIQLDNISSDNPQGILISEFFRRLVTETFTTVVESSKNMIPGKPQ